MLVGSFHEKRGDMTSQPSLLIVDDDPMVVRAVSRVVASQFRVVAASTAEEGIERLRDQPFSAAIVDVILPGMNGLEFLENARAIQPDIEVVMMTGNGSVRTAVQAMQKGAYDYLQKPFESLEKLVSVVTRAVERHALRRRNLELERLVGARSEMPDIIGAAETMRPVFDLIASVADTPATVLVTGESGTGKELVARSIHRLSKRKGAFISINCSAFPDTLLDSEFFGHVKGAFTGADRQRAGVFEAADRGTLFLDEVGDISLSTQVRLLRVLQDGELRRVGDNTPIQVDTRIVAATNVDVVKAVADGRMREDFYYRLNVVSVHLPPLRERVTDIPALIQHFIKRHAERMGRPASTPSAEATELLLHYEWPGNIRELENVIARCVVMTRGDTIEASALPKNIRPTTTRPRIDPLLSRLSFSEAKRHAVSAFERGYLVTKLREASGNITRAAEAAGLDRSNFRRLLRSHGIDGGERDLSGEGDGRPDTAEGRAS